MKKQSVLVLVVLLFVLLHLYTEWKFEYVKCDWSNCFDKIENGHIAKPIQVDKLLSIISEIIRQQD